MLQPKREKHRWAPRLLPHILGTIALSDHFSLTSLLHTSPLKLCLLPRSGSGKRHTIYIEQALLPHHPAPCIERVSHHVRPSRRQQERAPRAPSATIPQHIHSLARPLTTECTSDGFKPRSPIPPRQLRRATARHTRLTARVTAAFLHTTGASRSAEQPSYEGWRSEVPGTRLDDHQVGRDRRPYSCEVCRIRY